MKYKTKLLGIILISIFLCTFVIAINQHSIINENNLAVSNQNKVYSNQTGIPEDVEVTKIESMLVNIDPFGEIIDKRITVSFEFRNLGYENVSFQMIDRIEKAKPESFKIIRGSFDVMQEFEFVDNGTYGYMIIKFTNITLGPRAREDFGYVVKTNISLNYEIISDYYINNTKVELNYSSSNPKIMAPVGSKVTQVINLQKKDPGQFYVNSAITPPEIALITVILPYAEEEEEMDISEPQYSQAPIMENIISFIQQISWLALSNNFSVNWSATMLSGGGWGVLEVQPMMVTITKSAEMTSTLLDTLNGVIGLVTGLQAYWVSLVLDSIIEEFMALGSYMQYFFEMISLETNIMNMGIYSMINNLIMALVETNLIYGFVNDSINIINDVCDAIGPGDPNFWTLQEALNNLGITLDYISDVDRRITASFGAQMIELFGNPAVLTIDDMQILDILRLDSFYLNATASVLDDNSTDFYTKININNLTATSDLLVGLLNLTREYEFRIMDVPGGRLLPTLIDTVFGNVAFTEMSVPGSPNSTMPGVYTSFLSLGIPGEGSFWSTLGNLTRSIATQLLLLNATFSGKYGQLMKNASANVNITLNDPFIFETGASGISGLMNNIQGLQDKYQAPYGNPSDVIFPDIQSQYSEFSENGNTSDIDVSFLDNLSFYTQMRIYMDPILRIRNTLNFTIPFGNITALTGSINMTSIAPIDVADYVVEDGTKPDWVNSTLMGSQYNNASENIFKRFVVNGECNYTKNLLIPGDLLHANFRINDTNSIVDLEIYDEDTLIKKSNIQDLLIQNDTWYSITFDLANEDFWDYYDINFDKNHITAFKFIIESTNPVSYDIDYMNLTRSVLPYPNNISIYKGYITSDGIGLLENKTKYTQLNDGLEISQSFIEDICGDEDKEIIVGSTDKHIYVFKGKSGSEIWNISLSGQIVSMFIEDIIPGEKKEIVLGLNNGMVFVLNGTGHIIWYYLLENFVNCMSIGDINNDTTFEIIIASNDKALSVLSNTGDSIWNCCTRNKISDIEISDVNNDLSNEVIISTFSNSVKCLNGSNGGLLWEEIFDDDILKIAIGDLNGDNYSDVVAHMKYNQIFALSGNNGTELWNKTVDGYVYQLETIEGLSSYDDIVLSINANLTLLYGNNGTEKWAQPVNSSISVMKIIDVDLDTQNEIVIGLYNNIVCALEQNKTILWEYESQNDVKSIGMGDLDGNNQIDLCIGLMDNIIETINLTIMEKIWDITLGKWIVSFKFMRTSESLFIYYNLPEPISDLSNMVGINFPDLTSMTDLASFGSIESTEFNGLDSFGDLSTDMGDLAGGIPLNGIGLLNLIELESDLMYQFGGLSQVSSYRKAITGIFDVKDIGADEIDVDIFLNESRSQDWIYLQADVRNNEEKEILVNHFALDLKYNGLAIQKDRIIIQGYNTTSGKWIDLNEDVIENFNWELIGLDYINGNIIFTNYMQIDTNERELITTDWMLRQLRIKINTTGLDKNNISIKTWIDCSQNHEGVTINPISGSVSLNCIYPTILVYEIPPIDIPDIKTTIWIVEMVENPITWFFVVAAAFILSTFYYFNKREKYRKDKLATKKILKWVNRKQNQWDKVLMDGEMNIKKYSDLVRLKLRLKKQYKYPDSSIIRVGYKVNDLLNSNRITSDFKKVLLFENFWRDIGKRSELATIMDRMVELALTPVKWILKGLYWIPKGTFKLLKIIFVKKKKIVSKKRSLIEDTEVLEGEKQKDSTLDKVDSKTKGKKDPLNKYLKGLKSDKPQRKKKDKKEWKGETRNDGGEPIENEELPNLESKIGKIFYFIAKNKFIGVKLKEIAKEFDLSIHEALFYIIKLYEQGMIEKIREGLRVDYDLWDLSSKYKKSDPELDKIMDMTSNLYEEVAEGIIITESELSGKKDSREHKKPVIKELESTNTRIPIPKPVDLKMDLSKIENEKVENKKIKLPSAMVEEEK